jgi:cobalt-zinc-cadmium efflux system protein
VTATGCAALRRTLREDYQITLATLQVDHLGEDQDAGLVQVSSREAASTGPDPCCEDAHGPVHHPGPHQH